MEPIAPIHLDAILAARERITGAAIRTPLLPLEGFGSENDSSGGIWLKLECLQPIGSFKIRGAANAIAIADPEDLTRGVYTASAGNMAQGVALAARRLGISCRVIVPDSAPRNKIRAVERLGGTVVPVSFEEWWNVLLHHGHADESGFFVHPVCDRAVIAGNGTTGLEILEDLPDVDRIIVPYGGGGLSCGIASAAKVQRPEVQVFASEVETSAPLSASLEAGQPMSVARTPSFVDGIGGSSVLAEMWPLASSLLDGALVTSLDEISEAIRMLASRAHVIAEGAGGSAVAAATRVHKTGERTVAVVSGGNIDMDILRPILSGGTPAPSRAPPS